LAVETKRTLSAVFELAVSTPRAESGPVCPVCMALPASKTKHKRPLTTGEVGQLLRQPDDYDRNFQTVSVFRLMWLTLCRPRRHRCPVAPSRTPVCHSDELALGRE